MAVTVFKRDGKKTIEVNGTEKKVEFTYDKIITPATKRGSAKDSETALYPTLAEFVQFLGGKVEFALDKEGNATGECLLSYAITGWNLESNVNAAFKAANTPEVAISKIDEMIRDMAAKLGMPEDEIRRQLQPKS